MTAGPSAKKELRRRNPGRELSGLDSSGGELWHLSSTVPTSFVSVTLTKRIPVFMFAMCSRTNQSTNYDSSAFERGLEVSIFLRLEGKDEELEFLGMSGSM